MSSTAGTAVISTDPNCSSPAYEVPVYTRGALATRTVTFSVGGVPTNPTSVVATLIAGGGAVTTPTPTNPSTGVFALAVDTTSANGEWSLLWEGTGACQAAIEDRFIVMSQV